MVLKYLLDTNAVLYHLANRTLGPLPHGNYFVSMITEMELLAYPGLSADEAKSIRQFLSSVGIIGISTNTKQLAIDWRLNHGLKLPDAIIAATALDIGSVLITNDKRLLDVLKSKALSLELK